MRNRSICYVVRPGQGFAACPGRFAAFTLLELLIVISIVALLAALSGPALGRSKATAKGVQCLGNERQMILAAQVYCDDNGDRYPVAYLDGTIRGAPASIAWDLTTISGSTPTVIPGLLWQGKGTERIQQCPSFTGRANWLVDPFTGYNYNTSFIGHGQYEKIPEPAKRTEVQTPVETVIFGDGQYSGGANKFMRAPWPNPGDESFRGRWAGTQGFRHLGRSNAAFGDGHATSMRRRFTENRDGASGVASGTGFLSSDNSLYDLE